MSRPDQYYPDGFRGGSELPDDTDLDRMVYPEAPAKREPVEFQMGESYEDYERRVQERDEQARCDNFERDRRFEIEEGNVTGRKPGPPRTP